MLNTEPQLRSTNFPNISRRELTNLQVNLGYLCNLSCTHCHVNAGPKRTELASKETIDCIINFLDSHNIQVLDVTGGAPEMNPHFRYLVETVRSMGVEVIDRCNLTILNESGYEWVPEFLAQHQVRVTASLPCYQKQNVSEQRGKGVFESSILALKNLNALGYGRNPKLKLDLVYNPNGAFLPPGQQALQASYKEELKKDHDIDFNELLTITNMPIARFGSMLLSKGLYEEYMQLLRDNYSEKNLQGVMCRSLLSVDWQGYVYDCDFNQMLEWPLQLESKVTSIVNTIASDKPRVHLSELTDQNVNGNPIVIGDHCYACTAGQGSSCGGALDN